MYEEEQEAKAKAGADAEVKAKAEAKLARGSFDDEKEEDYNCMTAGA